MFEVTDDIRAVAGAEFGQGPASAALRRLAQHFRLQRAELAWLASEVFDNMLVPEVQAIWNWDLARDGNGHTDTDLDALLSHLIVRSGAGVRTVRPPYLPERQTRSS